MPDNRHLYTYNYFHQSKNFQLKPERTKKLVDKILEYSPRSVLDVGCGLAAVVNELRKISIDAIGCDFAPPLEKLWGYKKYLDTADARKLPYLDNKFDLVFSSDFFEHVDEEDIDQVASEMKRVGKKVIAFIADDNDVYLNARQRGLHVTHKPLSWWKNKLKDVEVFSSHDYEA